MGITAALAKIPWRKIFRYLPWALSITGQTINRREEKTAADSLRQLEARQKDLADALGLLASRLKIVFWAAIAALVVACAALAMALMR